EGGACQRLALQGAAFDGVRHGTPPVPCPEAATGRNWKRGLRVVEFEGSAGSSWRENGWPFACAPRVYVAYTADNAVSRPLQTGVRMEFRDAARILGEQVTTAEMAKALGVSHSTARQARMKPDAPGYRRPPENWRQAVAKLA